jgi:hypothetical protein
LRRARPPFFALPLVLALLRLAALPARFFTVFFAFLRFGAAFFATFFTAFRFRGAAGALAGAAGGRLMPIGAGLSTGAGGTATMPGSVGCG